MFSGGPGLYRAARDIVIVNLLVMLVFFYATKSASVFWVEVL